MVRNSATFIDGEQIVCDQAADLGGGAFCAFLQDIDDPNAQFSAKTIKDKLKELNDKPSCNTCGKVPLDINDGKKGMLTVDFVSTPKLRKGCKGRKVCDGSIVRTHDELLKEC
jgi:hypothetical protein